MRLIDADKFILSLNDYIDKPMTAGLCATLIHLFPPAYDIDKVVEELKDLGSKYCTNVSCNYECKDCSHGILMQKAIEIVEQGVR